MLSIIVAIAKNNVIGKDNELIWHLPEDLKRFKKITTGKTIIMGRKTFESLGRVLPNRKHIILTKSTNYQVNHEAVEIVNDISNLQEYIDSEEEHFVIGGGAIYNLLMPYTNKLYITKINEEFKGDTYFPKIDETIWNMVEIEQGMQNEENPYEYSYVTYERRKNSIS